MNCLECPNYWRTDIDETLCEECGTHKRNNNKEVDENGKADLRRQ